MQKLIGWLPDADPTTPGVITDCNNLIPYQNGMKAAPTGVIQTDVPALASACLGAAIGTKLDDSRRIFAGAATKIYELVTGSWTDRAGSAYSASADNRWTFAQFGDATLAANIGDYIQRSTTAAFATIATAPKARIIFNVGSFVMALNTIDGTYGTSPDRWWCCASFDDTSWTPSLSTLATTGRLVSNPGKITAGGRLGEYAVAYKDHAIYLGQFVGAPSVWDWIQVPGGSAGCVGPEAWCDIGGAHLFVSSDNLWIFDGSRPVPIGVGELRQWFFDNSEPSYRYRIKCVYDHQENNVWIFYPGLGATVCNKAIVYHLPTKAWGAVTVDCEAALGYISAGVTIDGLTGVSATIDGLSGLSFDSQFWLAGGRTLSVVNNSHQLTSLTGVNATSSFTTGDLGNDDSYSLLSKVRIRYAPGYKPTTATIQSYTKATEGDALTPVSTGSISDGKFDVLQSGRFHRFAVSMTGDARVLALGVTTTPEGEY